MRFSTKTRFKRLEELIQTIPNVEDRSQALHLLNAIHNDINENYAEIQTSIHLTGMKLRRDDK